MRLITCRLDEIGNRDALTDRCGFRIVDSRLCSHSRWPAYA